MLLHALLAVFPLFENAQGLLNPQAGDAYRQAILQPGGSKDPHRILIDYLGREPDISSFLNQLK